MSSSKNNNSVEQTKLNSLTSNVVTSSTLLSSSDSIPKLNIKLSNTDYPHVIHTENNTSESSNKYDTSRNESPLPKLTIRIPKPIDKPLEIITTGQSSPFRNSENESQQSPRIILKINKNTTSQTNETSTLTSTTIIATDELQTRSESPHLMGKQNEMKRSNYELSPDIVIKKQKLNADIVQLVSSDSEYDDKDQQLRSLKESDESQQTINTVLENIQTDSTNKTANNVSNATNSFNTNLGLRSILSRPQMKLQTPQNLQSFLQNLPPFNTTNSIPSDHGASKTNDVIDLCHDSNDQADDMSLNHETKECKDDAIPSLNPQSENQSTKSSYNWQFFYGDNVKEENQPVHPLLQQDIERANVLAAMMEAANKQESSMTLNVNNTATAIESADGFEQIANNSLLFENEGSSSDCIVIEDTASEPFPSEYSEVESIAGQNKNKKECVDRDSGVDVSNSVKSVTDEESKLNIKRPRGRPRKGNVIKPTMM